MSYNCSIYMVSPPKGKVTHLMSASAMVNTAGYYERHFLRRPKAKGDVAKARKIAGGQKSLNLIDLNF